MQVILSGFSVRLLCFVQAWLYVCLCCTHACVCVDVMVMSYA